MNMNMKNCGTALYGDWHSCKIRENKTKRINSLVQLKSLNSQYISIVDVKRCAVRVLYGHFYHTHT